MEMEHLVHDLPLAVHLQQREEIRKAMPCPVVHLKTNSGDCSSQHPNWQFVVPVLEPRHSSRASHRGIESAQQKGPGQRSRKWSPVHGTQASSQRCFQFLRHRRSAARFSQSRRIRSLLLGCSPRKFIKLMLLD